MALYQVSPVTARHGCDERTGDIAVPTGVSPVPTSLFHRSETQNRPAKAPNLTVSRPLQCALGVPAFPSSFAAIAKPSLSACRPLDNSGGLLR